MLGLDKQTKFLVRFIWSVVLTIIA